MELPCCVVSLCVQCNQEDVQKPVKSKNEQKTIKNLSKICPKLKHIIFPLAFLPPEIKTSRSRERNINERTKSIQCEWRKYNNKSLYGKRSRRPSYGHKVKLVKLNLALQASLTAFWQINQGWVVVQSCASGGDWRSSEFCRLMWSPRK